MKVIITERQFNLILKYKYNLSLFENDKVLNLSTTSTFGESCVFEDMLKGVMVASLSAGEKTKSRQIGGTIKDIIKNLIGTSVSEEEEKTIKEYFENICKILTRFNLYDNSLTIDKFETDKRNAITTLNRYIKALAKLAKENGLEEAKGQMREVNRIFNDERFKKREDEYKKKLSKFLTYKNLDLDEFFKKSQQLYLEYENSWSEGSDSPFEKFRTNPTLDIKMVGGKIDFFGIEIDPNVYNSLETDLNKINYIIYSFSGLKTRRPNNIENIIKDVIKNLNFKITLSKDNNVKADLRVKNDEEIIYQENLRSKEYKVICPRGSFVEVKKKPYNDPDYLSEFFKPDATQEKAMLSALEKTILAITQNNRFVEITGMENPNKVLKFLIKEYVTKLKNIIVSTDGEKIIKELTKNLSGIIFENGIFVPNKENNLKFYWNTTGWANKPRLSIFYDATGAKDIFKFGLNPNYSETKRGEENSPSKYTRFLTKI